MWRSKKINLEDLREDQKSFVRNVAIDNPGSFLVVNFSAPILMHEPCLHLFRDIRVETYPTLDAAQRRVQNVNSSCAFIPNITTEGQQA